METNIEEKANSNEIKVGYNTQELSRFKFPNVELKNRKLTINETSVEGLPEVDGFYVMPDASSVVAFVQKGDERKLFVLGRLPIASGDVNKFEIIKEQEDTAFEISKTKKTNHIIGQSSYLVDGGKEKMVPSIDGVKYEDLKDCWISDNGISSKLLIVDVLDTDKTLLLNPDNLSQRVTLNRDNNNYKINGVEWLPLKGRNIGYHNFAVDFENNKILFNAKGTGNNTNYEYFSNGKKWEFSTKDYSSKYGVENGFGYVATGDTLVIDDKKWNQNPIVTKSNGNDYSSLEHISIGGKDGKIAVSNQCTLENNDPKGVQSVAVWVNEVVEGDSRGPNKVWKNKIKIEKMKAGKNIIAAIGKDAKEKPTLLINDVLVDMKDDIAEFLDLNIQEDKAVVKYKTALGEVVSMKYGLEENSAEYEQMRVEKAKREESLNFLANFLFDNKLTPELIMKQLQAGEKLQQELDKTKLEKQEYNNLWTEERQKNILNNSTIEKLKLENTRLTTESSKNQEKIYAATKVLEANRFIKGNGKMFGGTKDSGLPEDVYNAFLKALQ